MQIDLKEFFSGENIEYFGMGDRECYIDYQSHARMGIWKSTVTREYEPYIKPQDCGNHINTKWLTLDNGKKVTFVANSKFEFSTLHYTLEELDEKRFVSKCNIIVNNWTILRKGLTKGRFCSII